MSFASDFAWQARLIPAAKAIIGPQLLITAPMTMDIRENTDLVVLHARDMRIACRFRRPGYAERYPNQFTVRLSRDTGATTELVKIIRGWGDWFFYAHEAADGANFDRWMLIDLDAFRAHLIVSGRSGLKPERQSNRDGTQFLAFDVRNFIGEPTLLIAASDVRAL
jgi:hypothetical protein